MKKQYLVMAGVLMLSLSTALGGCKKQERVAPSTVAESTTEESKDTTLTDVQTSKNDKETTLEDGTDTEETSVKATDENGNEVAETTEEAIPEEVKQESEMYESGNVMTAEGENGEPAEKQVLILRGTITAEEDGRYIMKMDDGLEMVLHITADTKMGDGVTVGTEVEMQCNGVMTKSIPAQVPVVYSIKTAEQADKDKLAEAESLQAIEDEKIENGETDTDEANAPQVQPTAETIAQPQAQQ